MWHRVLTAGIVLALAGLCSAQQPQEVTIREPGRMQLVDVFKVADIVVTAQILSGDMESYPTALYKVKVQRAFKGAKPGDQLYVAPYIGFKLGGEYLFFLRRASDNLAPTNSATAMYGSVPHADVFNEGYSAMAVSYECVFDGNEMSRRCDYGVRVCTDYIQLPNTIRVFPPKKIETPFGCRWTRRTDIESELERHADSAR